MNLLTGKNVHYNIAKAVERFWDIETEANELLTFFEENNGHFSGNHSKGYAIHHAQVSEEPYDFFVVAPELIHTHTFPEQIIINPTIIKAEMPVSVKEGCLSFPHRAHKTVERYATIEIIYLYWDGVSKMVPVKEKAQALKAQIFQHECQHSLGQNIFFDKPKQ